MCIEWLEALQLHPAVVFYMQPSKPQGFRIDGFLGPVHRPEL
jgi:hypothetical protein